jgi:hypothetical protein
MLDMTSAATKLVLVPAPRRADRTGGVRRYRLARLAVNPDRDRVEDSFEHLKRIYD